MSNCLYCGFPFEFSESASEESTAESPFHARIQRVTEHDEYATTLAWEPPPGLDYHRGQSKRRTGIWLLVIGAALGLFGFLGETSWTLIVLGALAAAGALWMISKGQQVIASETRWPLQKRACAIVDRRSETEAEGLDGRTSYHFLLEFEDGNRAEFRWPGRGTSHEPMSTGITGVAYTRGQTLLTFRQIRT